MTAIRVSTEQPKRRRAPGSAVDRFWFYAGKTGAACWIWTGSHDGDGYGRHYLNGSPCGAHRFAYELLVGPIPDGLVIDHLCRVRNCVNPAHMEPVTNAENVRRGGCSIRTHCPQGHPYDEANTRVALGRRHCRACGREKARARRHSKRMVTT
jgi:hypothetical protein